MNTSKTLLAILVEELPKRGGWPEGADYVVQDNDGSFDIKFGAGEATVEYEERGVWVNDEDPNWGIDTPESYIRDLKILASDAATSIITREQYEAALAAQAPVANADGWIDWAGGEFPVAEGTLVDIKHRDGDEGFAKVPGKRGTGWGNACAIRWGHEGVGGDIIAWRLHQPQAEADHKHVGGVSGPVTTAPDEADLNECIGQPQEDIDAIRADILGVIHDAAENMTIGDAFELAESLIEAGYRKQ